MCCSRRSSWRVSALLLWRCVPAAWQVGLAALAQGVAVDVRQVGAVAVVPALAFLLDLHEGWPRADQERWAHGLLATIPAPMYMLVQFAVAGQFTFTQRSGYAF